MLTYMKKLSTLLITLLLVLLPVFVSQAAAHIRGYILKWDRRLKSRSQACDLVKLRMASHG